MINSTGIIDLVWLADEILLAFAILSSLFIIIYALVKRILSTRHDRTVARNTKNIQDIMLKGPSVNREDWLALIDGFTINDFFEIVKSKEALAFKKNSDRFKGWLYESGKLTKIEDIAKKSLMKWKRVTAIITLGYINAPSSLAILEKTILDKDEDISYYSMLSLGQIKNNVSAEILLDFLEKRVYSGYKIVSVLENFPSTIVDEVIKKTGSNDPITRFWAIKLLTKFKPKEYMKKIEEFTRDKSPDVRAAACEFLGELGLSEVKESLLRCLNDKRCLPEVIHLINDSSPLVKQSVKDVMVHDIEKTLPYIESCLAGSDDAAKRYCVDALVDSMYVPTLLENVLSDNSRVKKRALILLDALIKSGFYFGLKKAINDFGQGTREKILEIIATANSDLVKRIKESADI